MSTFEIKMPKLGESVEEATITRWFVKEGDWVEEDQPLLEIATDKVDSEIPSPVAGQVAKILYPVDSKVAVGLPIAIIDLEGKGVVAATSDAASQTQSATSSVIEEKVVSSAADTVEKRDLEKGTRFYSPLVRSIAQKENISLSELEAIEGTGKNGRVRKQDVLQYLQNRTSKPASQPVSTPAATVEAQPTPKAAQPVSVSVSAEDEIVEMDRMRRLIADHMVMSKQVSPHVTNVLEADVTNLVLWRDKVKETFEKREGTKLTFMPAFIEATAKALKDFPMVNASVDGYKIILKKRINIGIAVALPSGNLIVPVIKDADKKSILGLAADLNTLADNARKNKLSPDDIQGGTFTITNFGTFKNLYGTPIINQPQVAILATGMIQKKPAVLETPAGDVIAIRHKMYLALTYDHRIIDGALGGAFLRRIADYLEQWDVNRGI
ncbi:MAG: dihydrolipoamide acetyltransferase family protein [Bacteroidales bacterium]|nr:dihydrolipoamide acetyltransferase family protein [Bacteroidales bacterium]HOK99089.1 dihydrolipoamide acetyltransferase family protein [Bacteroidales bacterium]HPO64947.1 dihydrolipoamide acetyltransferase family protein [Bacteroidales bacterium]